MFSETVSKVGVVSSMLVGDLKTDEIIIEVSVRSLMLHCDDCVGVASVGSRPSLLCLQENHQQCLSTC